MSGVAFTQAGRFLAVRTPLGPNALLLTAIRGREAVSEPFAFELELLAPASADVPFDKLLGQPAGVTLLPGDSPRFFHGVLSRMARGKRTDALRGYRATLVPAFSLLAHSIQSRVFQQKSVPEILKEVLAGLEVKYELTGQYPQRDYCVQYQESDFAFASRLMEEEGIWYRFDHSSDSHTLVLSDNSSLAAALPGTSKLIFDEEPAEPVLPDRVTAWETVQEVRASGVSLWDYAFQQPANLPNATSSAPESVTAGTVSHALKYAPNQPLTIFDGPGGYAKQFDDVSPTGGGQAEEFSKVYQDNARVARLRAEEEAARGLSVTGSSRGPQLCPGLRFSLSRHPDADGPYFLTSVTHTAELSGDYRSGRPGGLDYSNDFTCVPLGLAFRPPRITPRPRARGVESAVVVGPAGQAIYCDKYGRIKVRFLWDRRGTEEGVNASCWVRVAQPWAGKGWGAVTLPRVGQEVVVGFRHADPDMPVVLGGVYNGEQMPPFPLPENASQAGIKSSSMGSTDPAEFSGLAFEDHPGQEHVHLHSQKHLTHSAEDTLFLNAGSQHHANVGAISTRIVGGLPGVDHGLTTGAPASSGSGSGAGDGPPYASAGPFQWSPSVKGGMATDLDLVVGLKRGCTAGLYTGFTVGQWMASAINPLAAATAIPGFNKLDESAVGNVPNWPAGNKVKSALWASIFNANTAVNMGGISSFAYGPKLDIHRGYCLALDADGMTKLATLAATLFAAVAAFEILEPLIPGDTFTDLSAESIGMAVTSAVLVESVLALWGAIESKLALAKKLADAATAEQQATQLATNVANTQMAAVTTQADTTAATAAATALVTWINNANLQTGAATTNLLTWNNAQAANPALNQGGKDVFNASMYSIYSPYTRLVSMFDAANPPPTPGNSPFIGIQSVGGQGNAGFVPGYVFVYGDTTGIFGGANAYLTLSTAGNPAAGTAALTASGGPITITNTQGNPAVTNTVTLGPSGLVESSTSVVQLLSPPNPSAGPPPWPQGILELDASTGAAILHGATVTVGNHPRLNTAKQVAVTIGNGANGTTVTVQVEQSSITLSGTRIELQSQNASVTVDQNAISLTTGGTMTLQAQTLNLKAPAVNITAG